MELRTENFRLDFERSAHPTTTTSSSSSYSSSDSDISLLAVVESNRNRSVLVSLGQWSAM